MIDHDRALELAAAAIDFGLSDGDRVALQTHLDACPDCRTFPRDRSPMPAGSPTCQRSPHLTN